MLRAERLRARLWQWASACQCSRSKPPGPVMNRRLQRDAPALQIGLGRGTLSRAVAGAQEASGSGKLSLPSRLLSAGAESLVQRDVNVSVHESAIGTFLRVPRYALKTGVTRARPKLEQPQAVTVGQRSAAAAILTKVYNYAARSLLLHSPRLPAVSLALRPCSASTAARPGLHNDERA